jgi:hypothetical protein
MAKRHRITQKELDGIWKNLPEADRRFMGATVLLGEALGAHGLHYRMLSPAWMRRLDACDRQTLFTLQIECLGRLTGAPAIERVRRTHRLRKAGLAPPFTGPWGEAGAPPAARRKAAIRKRAARRR